MKKLITAGHSWTVQHMGLNQEFVLGSINHSDIIPNISGKYYTWVPLEELEKLEQEVQRLKEFEFMYQGLNK
jgi:hypothetical protein